MTTDDSRNPSATSKHLHSLCLDSQVKSHYPVPSPRREDSHSAKGCSVPGADRATIRPLALATKDAHTGTPTTSLCASTPTTVA